MKSFLSLFVLLTLSLCSSLVSSASLSISYSNLKGDVDGNGSVDVSDVNALINIVLGKNVPDDFKGKSDVNGDLNVDVSDLNETLNIILGKYSTPDRICLAYAPYYRSQLPRADIVTHICFSAAEVYVRNNVYQRFKIQGDNNTSAMSKVLALKQQNPNLKVLLSFTHTVVNSDNRQDGGFSAIAATESNRIKFAQDCLEYMRKWNLDGIDLDWEMPGLSWSGAACDPANDTDNFTLLVKQMRETFGTDYLITLAGYVMNKRRTTDGWKYFDLQAIKPYIDWVNIMTYDLDDASGGHRGFNSAVRSSTSYWDIDRTIAEYQSAGYDASHMVLGIPFYLRHSFETSPSAIDYRDFHRYAESVGYNFNNWDDDAMCPYATLDGVFFGSYDNVVSIAAKGERYVGTGIVRGFMYWDAGADDIDYTLSSACWKAVMKKY
ncbi:MAG: glycosyl hydrolase family 18 protein [Muribaculaceae bacterium]|nr:glycosyl hydrolase family 18 protein [Muribaculaceae bacterium]